MKFYDTKLNEIDFMGFMESSFEDKRVDLYEDDNVTISTVFLGMSVAGDGKGLWETMISFATGGDPSFHRWDTEEEAIIGHNYLVTCVNSSDG